MTRKGLLYQFLKRISILLLQFLVRLQMFAENSEKYRQELGDKTKRAVSSDTLMLFSLPCSDAVFNFIKQKLLVLKNLHFVKLTLLLYVKWSFLL